VNILIIDGDKSIRETLGNKLRREGFNILFAGNNLDGLRLFYTECPDFIVIDAELSQIDNFAICERVRNIANTPIMVLFSGVLSEDVIVRGLAAGADTFLVKPVRLNEFVARVRAFLRLTQRSSYNAVTYTDGYLSVNTEQQAVYVRGTQIHVTQIEFKLLQLLIENAGRVVTHQELVDYVWGTNDHRTDIRYPRIFINHLRMKVEPDHKHPIYIATEHRIGYRFQKRSRDNV
jgi:two-component system KDP operon response regulator KdpE